MFCGGFGGRGRGLFGSVFPDQANAAKRRSERVLPLGRPGLCEASPGPWLSRSGAFGLGGAGSLCG